MVAQMKRFSLRIPEDLMEQAREASALETISINQLLVSLAAEGLGHRRAILKMRERAARGNPEAALHILNHIVPDVEPDHGDAAHMDDNRGLGHGK
jgi:hypothetical protein